MARASTFTSYINAELPNDVNSKWQRYEQIATRTYSNIAKSAAAANRQIAGLQGGRGTAGGTAASRELVQASREQARQGREIERINGRVQRSQTKVTRSTQAQGRQMRRAAGDSNQLARSLSAVSTSLNIVQGPLGPLAGRVSAVSRAISELTGFRLGLAGVASSLFVIASVGNRYQQLEARLRGAYEAQTDVNRAMSQIEGIARNARTSLDGVADLYIRLTNSAEQFNITQERAARLTQTVSQAAQLSGGATESQLAGLTQFAQAFSSGVLQGDELRSVRENTYVLAQALATGLGVQIGQLKELAAEGELTSERVAEALEIASIEIEARYSRMPITFAQGVTQFKNSLTTMVGGIDSAIGFSSALAQAIAGLGGVLNEITIGVVSLGAAFAGAKLGGFANAMLTSIGRMRVMSAATKELTARRLTAAQAEQQSAQRSVAALNAQQAEIRETIDLETRRRRLATEDLRRVRNDPTANSARLKAALRAEIAAMQALNRARTNGKITADGLAAAELRLEQATRRVAAAQNAAAARARTLTNAAKSLWNVINPLGFAIGVATAALFTLGTRASETERILGTLSEESRNAANRALELAEANLQVADSYTAIAQAAGEATVQRAREAALDIDTELAGRVGEFAGRLGRVRSAEMRNVNDPNQTFRLAQIDRDMANLQRLAADLERDGSNTETLGEITRTMTRLAERYPQAGNAPSLGFLGRDTRPDAIRDSAIAAFTVQERLNDALTEQENIEERIALLEERRSQARNRPSAPVSVATLNAQAAVEATDTATRELVGARRRRDEALRELESEFVSGGNVAAGRTDEYIARRAEIVATFDREEAAIKSMQSSRTAASRQARAQARQEIRDNRDLLRSRLDLDLLALEQQRPDLTETEFYAQRLALLETYDREIELIDAAGSSSNRATAQMIRDTREMERLGTRRREQRSDILDRYSDEPRALTRAADQIEDLQQMVGTLIADATGALVIYTQEQADADAARIEQGVRAPLREAAEEAEQFAQVSELRLAGFGNMADALERALELQDRLGALTREEFETIVDQQAEQRKINDLLAQRERILQPHLELARSIRTEFEDLLVDLPERGLSSVGDFVSNMRRQASRIWARQISEALFGDTENRVRDLLGGEKQGVDRAYEFLAQHAQSTGAELDDVATSADEAGSALERLADSADRAASAPLTSQGSSLEDRFDAFFNQSADGKQKGQSAEELGKAVSTGITTAAGLISRLVGGADDGSLAQAPDGSIVVTGKRTTRRASGTGGISGVLGTLESGISQIFGKDALTDVFGKAGLGGFASQAFQGAAIGGAAADLIGGITGLKTSKTGALIGSAAGSIFGPIGSMVGGGIGSLIGGLFKSTARGSAIIGGSGGSLGINGYYGSSSDLKQQAGTLAGDVLDTIDEIAEAIGATVNASKGKVSIGIREDSINVDPQGRGYTKTSKFPDIKAFGQDQEAAIAFAVADLLSDGVIEGISQASQNILRSGQELQKAIEKVVAIESIPKQLKEIKDPVGFAIDELNAEFSKLIGYLKEGGATAKQFSEAEELYTLKRQQIIEDLANTSADAISRFMEDMIAGPNSPLNKRTVYENAQNTLDDFAERINKGEVVDEQKLLEAAGNFQEASRNLFGSGASFFSDFDGLYSLLDQARSNILSGTQAGADGSGLPPSPFENDTTVRALLDQYNGVTGAVNSQTDVLADLLGQIRDGIYGGQGVAPGASTFVSSLHSLPGFGGGGSVRRGIPQEQY